MAKAKTETMLRKLKRKKGPSLREKIAAAVRQELGKQEVSEIVSESLEAGYVDEIFNDIIGSVLHSKEMRNHFRSLVRKELTKRSPQLVKDFTSGVGLFT